LNYEQALELAMLIARRMNADAQSSSSPAAG
jgi:hypothetical protein